MQLVESAQFYPGECVLGGGHKDLVDFERTMPVHADGARMYVAQQHIADAARLMGFLGPEEVRVLRKANEELAARLVEAEQKGVELEALRAAVRATLDAGATVDGRTGEKKLRLPHGVKREQVPV